MKKKLLNRSEQWLLMIIIKRSEQVLHVRGLVLQGLFY